MKVKVEFISKEEMFDEVFGGGMFEGYEWNCEDGDYKVELWNDGEVNFKEWDGVNIDDEEGCEVFNNRVEVFNVENDDLMVVYCRVRG